VTVGGSVKGEGEGIAKGKPMAKVKPVFFFQEELSGNIVI